MTPHIEESLENDTPFKGVNRDGTHFRSPKSTASIFNVLVDELKKIVIVALDQKRDVDSLAQHVDSGLPDDYDLQEARDEVTKVYERHDKYAQEIRAKCGLDLESEAEAFDIATEWLRDHSMSGKLFSSVVTEIEYLHDKIDIQRSELKAKEKELKRSSDRAKHALEELAKARNELAGLKAEKKKVPPHVTHHVRDAEEAKANLAEQLLDAPTLSDYWSVSREVTVFGIVESVKRGTDANGREWARSVIIPYEQGADQVNARLVPDLTKRVVVWIDASEPSKACKSLGFRHSDEEQYDSVSIRGTVRSRGEDQYIHSCDDVLKLNPVR